MYDKMEYVRNVSSSKTLKQLLSCEWPAAYQRLRTSVRTVDEMNSVKVEKFSFLG